GSCHGTLTLGARDYLICLLAFPLYHGIAHQSHSDNASSKSSTAHSFFSSGLEWGRTGTSVRLSWSGMFQSSTFSTIFWPLNVKRLSFFSWYNYDRRESNIAKSPFQTRFLHPMRQNTSQ
ncbi:hypothetical protein CSPX01_12576, partial [Colletotrichum filicis]